MRITIAVPSIGRVAGGAFVLYQYANHLHRRGHEVHVCHLFFTPEPKQPLMENAAWFSFDEGLHHHCVAMAQAPRSTDGPLFETWPSDVMIGGGELSAGYGLPVGTVQGRTFGISTLSADRMDGPLVCVSRNVIDERVAEGVDPDRLIHVPNGLDHDVFKPTRPLEGRPPRVASLVSWLPAKGSRRAVEILERVREEIPELEVTTFGAGDEAHPIPEWMDYATEVDQRSLARDVYSSSRIYLCVADHEGFGLTSLEAMACGAALVTTDTGGSREYAEPGRTALVREPGDDDGLARDVIRLLRDERLRLDLAESGIARAADFDWARTAALLEDLFERYLADPGRYLTDPGRYLTDPG